MNRAPWLAHYDEGIPHTLAPYPNRTLVDFLEDAARERPNAAALLYKGAKLTYAELERLSDACAAAFQSFGVERGDRVGLLLPNCPQFLIVQFAVWKLGAIVSPLSPIYTEHELEGPIREQDMKLIVTLTRFYPRVKRVQARTGLTHIVATNIKDYFPPVLRLLFTLAREKRDGDRIALDPADSDLARLLKAHARHKVVRAAITGDDPAVILMSGGTTGVPKGAVGRHGAYIISGFQEKAWTSSALRPDVDVILLPLPLCHVYAQVGVLGLGFINRNPLAIVPNPRDIPDLLHTIRRVKPTFFVGVPTLYIALLNHPDVQKGAIDFTSIKLCFSGGAALLADTKHRFESITGGRIVEGYSLTEGMMALCVNPVLGRNKLASVGMPLPDVRVRIFDADDGTREMPTGEVGEIALSGAQLMTEYWRRPDESAGLLRDHSDEEGSSRWLHTGDLGYLDEDGYVFIVDRKKDLIKCSGHQVWPREIEEVLATHAAVAEVGVAGVFDEVKGEAVRAWVVLRSGHTCTEHELRMFCREKLAAYKVPARIEFRSELPKTMVGKVLRRALRESALGEKSHDEVQPRPVSGG